MNRNSARATDGVQTDQPIAASDPQEERFEAHSLDAFVSSSLAAEVNVDGEDIWIFPASVLRAMAGIEHAESTYQADDEKSHAALTVRRVANLIAQMNQVQSDEASASRSRLVRAMLVADIDPVPEATVSQALKQARHRERLLASGAYNVDALRAMRRDSSASATRTWLGRRRAAGELFTVSHDGATLLPTFQLDDDGQPRRVVAAVLSALAPSGLGTWALWSWFATATPWLGGGVPQDMLGEPDRVVTAAKRFASNAA